MTGFLRFPDVQRLLVADLEELAGPEHTGIKTPADLAAALPFVRIMRTGGFSTVNDDFPIVDIDVFAATYDEADNLSELIRQRVVGPPPAVALIDRASCDIVPRELPWGDGSVRRFNATYSLTTRRRRIG